MRAIHLIKKLHANGDDDWFIAAESGISIQHIAELRKSLQKSEREKQ